MSEGNAPYLSYPLCNSLYIGTHGIKFINSYSHPEPYYVRNDAVMELNLLILILIQNHIM